MEAENTVKGWKKWAWSFLLNIVLMVTSVALAPANLGPLLIAFATLLGIFIYIYFQKSPNQKAIGIQWNPTQKLIAYHFVFALIATLTMNIPGPPRGPFTTMSIFMLGDYFAEIYYGRYTLSITITVVVYLVWLFLGIFFPGPSAPTEPPKNKQGEA